MSLPPPRTPRPGRRANLGCCGCLSSCLPVLLLPLLALAALLASKGLTPSSLDRELRQGWSYVIAGLEMSNLARQLRVFHLGEGRFPQDLQAFTAQALGPVRGRRGHPDPWGRPYLLEPGRGRFTLRSAGRDRRPRTRDDLVVESTLAQGSELPRLGRSTPRGAPPRPAGGVDATSGQASRGRPGQEPDGGWAGRNSRQTELMQ